MAFVSSPVGIASNQNAFVAKSVNKVSAKPAQASIVMMGNDYLRSITQKSQSSTPASSNGNGSASPSASASSSSKPANKAPLSYAEYMKLRGNNATTAPSASAASASSPASSSVSRPSVSTGGEMNYLTALEKKTVPASTSTPAPGAPVSYLDSIKSKPSSNGASYTPAPAPVSYSKPASNGKAPLSYEEYMKSRQGGASATSSSTPSAAGGESSYLKALEKSGTNSASSGYSAPSSGSYLDSISRRN